jgi:U4/U6.U5 tri-snRNP component SNU23
MSTNLNYKQATNVKRRTWDVEAFELKANERAKEKEAAADATAAAGPHASQKGGSSDTGNAPKRFKINGEEEVKEEFKPAEPGAAGPEGSKRAFLQPRQGKVDIDSKVGATEIISAEAAAKSSLNDSEAGSSKDGVTKSGVGWHCSVCDCFLKDSMTYLDHVSRALPSSSAPFLFLFIHDAFVICVFQINGRKHQRKLGFSMRVERSTKDQMLGRLSHLAKEKERSTKKSEAGLLGEEEETDFQVVVKKKDENEKQKAKPNQAEDTTGSGDLDEDGAEDHEPQAEAVDPALAAMMGFSSFGGGGK